jgi:hypothetical protein
VALKCTTQGCRKKARKIVAWQGRGGSRAMFVAPYCANHGADVEVDLGGVPAAGPALSAEAKEIEGIR